MHTVEGGVREGAMFTPSCTEWRKRGGDEACSNPAAHPAAHRYHWLVEALPPTPSHFWSQRTSSACSYCTVAAAPRGAPRPCARHRQSRRDPEPAAGGVRGSDHAAGPPLSLRHRQRHRRKALHPLACRLAATVTRSFLMEAGTEPRGWWWWWYDDHCVAGTKQRSCRRLHCPCSSFLAAQIAA